VVEEEVVEVEEDAEREVETVIEMMLQKARDCKHPS